MTKILIFSLFLSACTPAPELCPLFAPIYPSRKDTDETLRQIYLHNQSFESICGVNDEP